jgi:WD40 repeat protein
VRFSRIITTALTSSVLVFAIVASGIPLFPRADAQSGRKPAIRDVRAERLPAPILSLDVAPGSDLAAAALSDGRVRAWHLDTGELVHEFGFTEPDTDQRQKDEGEVEPIRVRFAPDGKTLGVSYLSRVHLYNVGAWSKLKAIGVEGEDVMRPIQQPQLSSRPAVEKEPDDINTGTRKWFERKTRGDGRIRITDFAFARDGAAMVVSYCGGGCYDMPSSLRWMYPSGHDLVRLWEVKTGQMVWEHYSDPNQIAERVVPSPDGKLLVEVVFQPGRWLLRLMELMGGRELHLIVTSIRTHEPPDVAFTSDSQHFVSLWNEPRKLGQMTLFDTATGQVVDRFIDRAAAQRVAISTNGLWLAITTWRGVAFRVWDLEKRKPLLTMTPRLSGVHVRSLDVRFAMNDRRIVVSDKSNSLVFTYELTDVPPKSTNSKIGGREDGQKPPAPPSASGGGMTRHPRMGARTY